MAFGESLTLVGRAALGAERSGDLRFQTPAGCVCLGVQGREKGEVRRAVVAVVREGIPRKVV